MKERIKNLSIGKKLYVLVGVALIGMFAIGLLSIKLMGNLNGETLIIAEKWMPSLNLAEGMNTTLSNIRLDELAYVTNEDPADAATYAANLAEDVNKMDTSVASYGSYVSTTEGKRNT